MLSSNVFTTEVPTALINSIIGDIRAVDQHIHTLAPNVPIGSTDYNILGMILISSHDIGSCLARIIQYQDQQDTIAMMNATIKNEEAPARILEAELALLNRSVGRA